MTMQTLSDAKGWTLEHSHQDIRHRPLMNNQGRQVGVVRELLVDLDHERVESVVTDAGETYAVEGLEIRPDHVVAHDPPISSGAPGAMTLRPIGTAPYQARLTRPS